MNNQNTKTNAKNTIVASIVETFVILSQQFRFLLKYGTGKEIFPFNDKTLPAIKVLPIGEDKVEFTVGSEKVVANLPSKDDGLGDRIFYNIQSDGKVALKKVAYDEIYHPLRREGAKTRLPSTIFAETDKPVSVFAGELVRYFANGEEFTDQDVDAKRKIIGADILIIYTKSPTGFIDVVSIIGNGSKYSDAAVKWFKNVMLDFHRKPSYAFDHLPILAIKAVAKTLPVKKAVVVASTVAKPAITKIATQPAPKEAPKATTKVVALKPKAGVIPVIKTKPQPAQTGNAIPRTRKKFHKVHSDLSINNPFDGLKEMVKAAGLSVAR